MNRSWRWPSSLGALANRNFRTYFTGQLISLVGTWMQTTALQWLVYRLTDSTLAVGAVTLATALPTTVLSLYAGVVVDRSNRRRLLIGLQAAMMALALGLTVLSATGLVAYWHVLVVAGLLGVANTFDLAARNALVGELVEKRDLANAIALNSTTIQGARLFGPALAGLVVANLGETWAFAINALSFLAVLIGLGLIHLDPRPRARDGQAGVWPEFGAGLQFIVSAPGLRALLLLVITPSVFGFPLLVLFPALARDVLGLGADGYGGVLSVLGFGALAGALGLTTLGQWRPRGRLVMLGSLAFPAAIIVLGSTPAWAAVVPALLLAGWAQVSHLAMTNTLIQDQVTDVVRGRVLAAYIWVVIGLQPLGGLMLGAIAEAIGPQPTLQLAGALCLLAAMAVHLAMPVIRRLA
jgi:MFS family permease